MDTSSFIPAPRTAPAGAVEIPTSQWETQILRDTLGHKQIQIQIGFSSNRFLVEALIYIRV